MQKITVLMLTLLSIGAAQADGLTIQVDHLSKMIDSYPKAVLKVTNASGTRYKNVGVECAFLAGGKGIGVNSSRIENLGGNETAWAEITLLDKAEADEVRCRVTSAR